ncbi:hypothetical protein [Sphingobium sp. Z007]|uniref:hypothetical protein n=1 Tax=Sphingobium sp. Z007 TaxID=627495 RepID=UPI000B49EC24|nr:hypothetical protein [Sphingobium sp. Z007]
MEQMIPTEAEVLARIDKFCAEHEIPPTTFGRLAVGDSNLVSGLRRDRSVTLRTGRRIIEFMAAYPSPSGATAQQEAA